MTVADLIQLREDCGLTQRAMALAMGLGLRAYQDIEGQDRGEDLHQRHKMLAERAALDQAVDQGDISLAPMPVRRKALDLARLITGV